MPADCLQADWHLYFTCGQGPKGPWPAQSTRSEADWRWGSRRKRAGPEGPLAGPIDKEQSGLEMGEQILDKAGTCLHMAQKEQR